LFTLSRKPAKGIQRFIPYKKQYRLTLWCEHPACLHPWPRASYDLSSLKEWLTNVAKYSALVFKVLRVAIPVALAAEVILNPELLKEAEREIELMESLVEEFPGELVADTQEVAAFGTSGRLTRVHAAAARAFRIFMFRRDPYQVFGGLRRYIGASGEPLWICSVHAREYDPGLPDIPES
jgi:hypothetical protein